MKQSRKPYVFLLVLVLSTSIVTTGLFFGFRRAIGGTTSPNSNVPAPSPTTPCSFCSWQQIGNDIDGEAAYYDISGEFVSLSSDAKTVAIGAPPYYDGNGGFRSHVRIFQWTESTSTWTQVGADIDGEAAGDNSGQSLSLSSDGKTVAIGARGDNDGNGDDSGHVRIFRWNHN